MSTAKATPKLLYKRAQIVEMLGISRSHLYQMLAAGEFPEADVKAGSLSLWKVETVERWIDGGGTKGKGGS